MEDTSLDDFLDDSEDDSDSEDSESEIVDSAGSEDTDSEDSEDVAADSEESVPEGPGVAVADPEPPTSRWRPDGAACSACTASVTRLWHDDGQFVCASCKDWR